MERKYYFRGLGLGIVVTAVIMGIASSRGRAMTDQEIIARAKELGMVENTVLSALSTEGEEDTGNAEGEAGESRGEDSGTEADKDKNRPADDKAAGESADADGAAAKEEQAQGTGNQDDGNQTERTEQPDGSEKTGEDQSEPDGSETVGEDQPEPDGSEKTGEDRTQTDDDEKADAGQAGREAGVSDETDVADAGQAAEDNGGTNSAGSRSITVKSGDGSHTVAKKLADAGIVLSADAFDEFLCQNGYDKKLRTGTFHIPAGADDDRIARIVTGAE